MTYYAVALNEKRQIAQLLVTRENGKQISQTFTGVTYKSQRAALADLARLNA